jgi:hypothetical protein
MTNCHLCGQPIGILDSTTSYLDASGNRVEVHTTCKNLQQSSYGSLTTPEMFTPTTEPEVAVGSKKLLYVTVGVVAVALIVGAIMLGAGGNQ